MVIRSTPKNKDNYIIIGDNDIVKRLQYNGFMPKYVDDKAFYFVKTQELESFMVYEVYTH